MTMELHTPWIGGGVGMFDGGCFRWVSDEVL